MNLRISSNRRQGTGRTGRKITSDDAFNLGHGGESKALRALLCSRYIK